MKNLLNSFALIAGLSLIGYALYNFPNKIGIDTFNKMTSATASNLPDSQHGWQVKPGSVYDGDTLRVVRGNEELKIRFCGIDAPEKEQPLGIESRDYLQSLIDRGNGEVILVPIEQDRYGRTVAELFVPIGGEQELFLNGEMIAAGMAWHYERYSSSCPNQSVLVNQEAIAKSQGLGVHQSGNVKPWEWRKSN